MKERFEYDKLWITKTNDLFSNQHPEAIYLDLDEKEFLEKEIRNYSKDFTRTELLYQYDPLNKTSFHKYIDNIEDIVVLCRLNTGKVVGFYSKSGFIKDREANDQGIMFSIKGGKPPKAWKFKQNKRSVVYDDNFLIGGNSDFRISHQGNMFFSNFRINSSFVDTKEKVQNFIGGFPTEQDGKDQIMGSLSSS